jgi:uncharacterized damage-inducible protein DinB
MASLSGTLLSLIDYDAWATARVLDGAAALTDEQLSAPAGAPDRSVLRLLTHAIGTAAFWPSVLRGEPLPSSPAPPGNVPELRERARSAHAAFREFVAGLSDSELDTPFARDATTRTWLDQIVQVLQHAIHHRGEVASLLTDRGHSPGDLDYVFYLRDRDASV